MHALLGESVAGAGRLDPTWGWLRTEPLLSAGVAWEGSRIWEPSVLIDNANSQYRMYYDGGDPPASSNQAMGLATCALADDPTVTAHWTKNAGNPIFGKGGSSYASVVTGSNVYYDGASTWYCYFYDGTTTSDLMVATSSDGLTWGTPATAIAHDQVAWAQGWANSFVWNDGSWKMLVDASLGSSHYGLAYATSSDGLTWTVQGSGVFSGLQIGSGQVVGASWLARGGAPINGKTRLFYHSAPGPDTNYTNIYSAYSTDPSSAWTAETTAHVSYTYATFSFSQCADASVVEHGGATYLFYSGVNLSVTSWINVAKFAGTVEELLNPDRNA